jgi:phosphonate dehydrogenase
VQRVVVAQPVFAETRRLLEAARLDLDINPGPEPWSDAELRRRCAEADGLLAFMTERVDAAFLATCPRLRAISCALKGFDNFDAAACAEAGVWLTVVPDLLTEPTAELALALALALGRNLLAGDALVRAGRFEGWRPALYGAGLSGSAIGIAGMGRVGRAIARRAAAFGPRRLLGHDAGAAWPEQALGVERAGLEELFRACDFVFLALPLTAETLHLIGDRLLAAARGVRLVNIGRGGVVDELAIARALEVGWLAGYAADVFELEDWATPGRPREVPTALRALEDRTVFTPHLGSAVTEVRRRIETAAARNLVAALSGLSPPDAVARPSHPRRPHTSAGQSRVRPT